MSINSIETNLLFSRMSCYDIKLIENYVIKYIDTYKNNLKNKINKEDDKNYKNNKKEIEETIYHNFINEFKNEYNTHNELYTNDLYKYISILDYYTDYIKRELTK